MACPVCKSINTGKIGPNAYYCADCLLEFTENGGETEIFYIDAEGSSVALKDKEAALKVVESFRGGSDPVMEKELKELILKSESLER